jgi:hypothetical protein
VEEEEVEEEEEENGNQENKDKDKISKLTQIKVTPPNAIFL